MAYDISSQLQEALDAPERYSAVFVTFVLGSNTYGFWTGQGTITYNSIEYVNGASLFELSDIQMDADGSTNECIISLSTSPDKGLTTDVLLSFYDENWQFGRVTIQLAMLDPETGEPVGAVTFIRGVIYEAPYKKGRTSNKIEARVVSQTIKMSENGGIYRNASTQYRLDPTDTALEGIGTLGGAVKKKLKWGQV